MKQLLLCGILQCILNLVAIKEIPPVVAVGMKLLWLATSLVTDNKMNLKFFTITMIHPEPSSESDVDLLGLSPVAMIQFGMFGPLLAYVTSV